LERYTAQSSLFQHIPVKRIKSDGNVHEYKIVSHEEADEDGMETRFICKFHYNGEVYETLSQFPFDIDYVTMRKGYPSTFTEAGKDVVSTVRIVKTAKLVFLVMFFLFKAYDLV